MKREGRMRLLYQDKDWLEDKYINQKLSGGQIAKLHNVGHTTIWNWLNKFNISWQEVPPVQCYSYKWKIKETRDWKYYHPL